MLMKSEGGHEAVPTNAWATSGGLMTMPISPPEKTRAQILGFGQVPPPALCTLFGLWYRRRWKTRSRSCKPF